MRLTAADPTTLLAPIGQDGRVRRNTFRAGNVIELDLSLSKNLHLSAGRRLLLRADIFNFINRANFGIPVRLLGAQNFGQAISILGKAIKADPKAVAPHMMRAQLLGRCNKYREALDDVRAAYATAPSDPEVVLALLQIGRASCRERV